MIARLKEAFGRWCADVLLGAMAVFFTGREVILVEDAGERFAIVSQWEGEFFVLTTSGAKSPLFHGLRTIRVHFSRLRLGRDRKWRVHL